MLRSIQLKKLRGLQQNTLTYNYAKLSDSLRYKRRQRLFTGIIKEN